MNNTRWPDPAAFWRRRRVCVTGGTGFLGSFLVDKLRAAGAAEVFAPQQAAYDLRQKEAILAMLRETRPDLVFHLAASAGGSDAGRAHPARFFYDTMMLDVQLLHECWWAGVEKFVAIGAACAGPRPAPAPFKEEELWPGCPEETGAPSDLAGRMLLVQGQAYRAQYDFNAIFLQPATLYGPGDNFDPAGCGLIPALVRQCLEAKERGHAEIVAGGDGRPGREFLYVADAAEAILLAAERYDGPDPVALASSFEISRKELAETIARLAGFEGRIRWDTPQPTGQPCRKLDASRAEQLFGFRSQAPFEEGLRRTINWYRDTISSSTPEIPDLQVSQFRPA